MKTNIIKRFITITAALTFTFAMSAGTVSAQGALPNGFDNDNGTITDGGLVWLKNADCFGKQNWQTATNSAAGLHSGMCGLTDKSTAGQWRLPTLPELKRRIRNDSGFNNVQSGNYWTSESFDGNTKAAWYVSPGVRAETLYKSYNLYVWPVRAGQ